MRFGPGIQRLGVVLVVLVCMRPLDAGAGQEFFPSPPLDQTPIYTLDEQNRLMPLPFEDASTPVNPNKVAKSTKKTYVEVKGEHATVTLGAMPRLFLFTPQRSGSHPPFLVWLTAGRGVRRATAIAQSGLTGLAISSDEIVKPAIRVIAIVGDKAFMELRPRISLVPGEYAIIGDDLTRITTFRVATEAVR
jgi:hypothetical protein